MTEAERDELKAIATKRLTRQGATSLTYNERMRWLHLTSAPRILGLLRAFDEVVRSKLPG